MRRFILAALAACTLGTAPPLVGAGSEWTSPGGDAGKTHHSALTGINAGNVGTLGPSLAPRAAWKRRR